MKIVDEHNETVVHFGRVLSEKEKSMMEICLAFFQSGVGSNSIVVKETASDDSLKRATNGPGQ